MRILGNIHHPNMRITVFTMNDKYIIRFEAGLMEQLFKISQTEINGIESIEKMLDEEFIKKIIDRFNEMFLSFNSAKERIK